MTWRLDFTSQALGDLQRLDRGVQKRIVKKLESCLGEPSRAFRKLVDNPQYRLRVGDYRVLALLEFQGKVVVVLRIGHRSGIYKP